MTLVRTGNYWFIQDKPGSDRNGALLSYDNETGPDGYFLKVILDMYVKIEW